MTFFDAFVDYYKNDMGSSFDSYKSQYTDAEWEKIIDSMLKNSLIEKFVQSGYSDKIQVEDSEAYKQYYTEGFINDVAKNFLSFVTTFYGKLRG